MIHFIKTQAFNIPVAVLTNGTLLFHKEVRDDIKDATIVIPSLDTVTEKAFAKIVRPDPKLSIDIIIEGLIQFRKEFTGQIWLEVFIVPNINDTKSWGHILFCDLSRLNCFFILLSLPILSRIIAALRLIEE